MASPTIESFLDYADRELPRILTRRFEAGEAGSLEFCPNPESREQLKQFILSEFEFGLKQVSANFRGIVLRAEELNQLSHMPSIGSCTDSGYASLQKCSSIDCQGGCMLCISPAPSATSAQKCGDSDCISCIECVDMATPSLDLPQSSSLTGTSFSQHVRDGCIDPSMLSNPMGRLSSTTDMDDFVEGQFPNEQSWPW
jgi:hypothetical protein